MAAEILDEIDKILQEPDPNHLPPIPPDLYDPSSPPLDDDEDMEDIDAPQPTSVYDPASPDVDYESSHEDDKPSPINSPKLPGKDLEMPDDGPGLPFLLSEANYNVQQKYYQLGDQTNHYTQAYNSSDRVTGLSQIDSFIYARPEFRQDKQNEDPFISSPMTRPTQQSQQSQSAKLKQNATSTRSNQPNSSSIPHQTDSYLSRNAAQDTILRARDLLVEAYSLTPDRGEQAQILDLLEIFREYTERGNLKKTSSIIATQVANLETATRKIETKARTLAKGVTPATPALSYIPTIKNSEYQYQPQPQHQRQPQQQPQSQYPKTNAKSMAATAANGATSTACDGW